jgi:hypothetical protein
LYVLVPSEHSKNTVKAVFPALDDPESYISQTFTEIQNILVLHLPTAISTETGSLKTLYKVNLSKQTVKQATAKSLFWCLVGIFMLYIYIYIYINRVT